MRVPGYCERCRRFRLVRVDGAGLGLATIPAVGVCDECEEKGADDA